MIKRRLISAWLALRGIIDYESVAKAQAEANAMAKMMREQDGKLWEMSQQPSWERMRPIFAQLMEKVNVRKDTESKRIAELIIPEIEETYGQRMAREESNRELRRLRG